MTLPIPARSDLDGSERRAALSSAIAAWRLRLGGAHVITEAGTLQAAQTATFATGRRIPAILRPDSTQAVVDCVRTAYWGNPAGFNMTNDLDRDRCGLLWLCPALPFGGPEARQVFDRVEACAAQHGFEPHIGMSARSARQLIAYATLVWNRDEPGADERARPARFGKPACGVLGTNILRYQTSTCRTGALCTVVAFVPSTRIG